MLSISGAWPTMVTPFDESNRIDSGVYRAMIEWYLRHRVGGLYANCLSSEMFALSPDERLLLVREAVRAAGGRCAVAATGNLGATVEEQVVFCQQVADAGADIVMLVVPEHLDREDLLERYYLSIAEQVDAPLGLYECPVPRAFHLSPELVGRLAHTGRFYAYKETSCELDRMLAHLKAIQGTPLALMQANTPYMLEAVRAGAPGSMTIAAIWLPDFVAEVIDRAKAGDPAADEMHAALCAMKLAQRSVHPVGSKYLLSRRGVHIGLASRAAAPLRAETIHALDYAARAWLDDRGDLRALSHSG